jgi:hypothetical protein
MYNEIPQPQFEKPKKLESLLLETAQGINSKLSESFGKEPVVDESCSIRPESFLKKYEGPYSDESVSQDEEYVYQKEKEWAGIYSENTRAWYKERGITEEKEMIADWHARREKQMHTRFEKYATVLFNKMLGEKFLFIRTCASDDYRKSVDNFIIDEETGNIICAFDSLNYSKPKEERTKDRKEEKMERVQKSISGGGSSVKYGLGFENKKYVKKQLSHLPLFFVSLDNDEAHKAIERLENSGGVIGEDEHEIFEKFINSFEEQIANIEEKPMHAGMKKSIETFKEALTRMRLQARAYKQVA